ncbi:MAG TPA: tetratricopeptide repeat protein, partial [Gemmatimonadales bacterium]|nr:tetratricopeptide repeat protein [Gemmatimonadales bacterium]
MSLEKLKDTARKFEQKEDWRKAIEVYLKAIQQSESGKDATPDLSLYNRVGDLYLKVADTASAVRHYERAVDLYADQGFFNNAIALCGKILRVNPGRTQTYLRLAQLHARKNVVIEAKRNLLEYLERMYAQGQLDEAFRELKAFADQFSASQDIRLMLVELLRAASRTEEAREQLEKLSAELEAHGGERAGPSPPRVSSQTRTPAREPESPSHSRGGDLIFLDTGFGIPDAIRSDARAESDVTPPDSIVVEGLVLEASADASAAESLGGTDVPIARVEGIELSPSNVPDASITGLGGLEPATLDAAEAAGQAEAAAPEPIEGLFIEVTPAMEDLTASGGAVEFERVVPVEFDGQALEGADDAGFEVGSSA